MEQIVQLLQHYGVWGLFLISFVESFISPILPDVLLIPLVLASPDQALYYSVVATLASVLGGFIGYGIGNKFGSLALHKFVPPQHSKKLRIGSLNTAAGLSSLPHWLPSLINLFPFRQAPSGPTS